MDEGRLKELLARVQAGDTPVEDAFAELRQLPFADLGFAMVDHHRAIRQGVPEVILGEGKTPEQIVGIARELARMGQNVLVTRISPEQAAIALRDVPGMKHSPAARTLRCPDARSAQGETGGPTGGEDGRGKLMQYGIG